VADLEGAECAGHTARQPAHLLQAIRDEGMQWAAAGCQALIYISHKSKCHAAWFDMSSNCKADDTK
jgi:hypothetical protein